MGKRHRDNHCPVSATNHPPNYPTAHQGGHVLGCLSPPHTCTNYQIQQFYLLIRSGIWPLLPYPSPLLSPGHFSLQSRWLQDPPKSSSLEAFQSPTNTVAKKLLINANLVRSLPWLNLSSSIRPLGWFRGYPMICPLITCLILHFAIYHPPPHTHTHTLWSGCTRCLLLLLDAYS